MGSKDAGDEKEIKVFLKQSMIGKNQLEAKKVGLISRIANFELVIEEQEEMLTKDDIKPEDKSNAEANLKRNRESLAKLNNELALLDAQIGALDEVSNNLRRTAKLLGDTIKKEAVNAAGGAIAKSAAATAVRSFIAANALPIAVVAGIIVLLLFAILLVTQSVRDDQGGALVNYIQSGCTSSSQADCLDDFFVNSLRSRIAE
jgi:hypothetical protein